MGEESLLQWADEWQMEFNKEKRHIIHLGRNNKRYQYTMGGVPGVQMAASEFEKDLGVLVHQSLKPSLQCGKAAKKDNYEACYCVDVGQAVAHVLSLPEEVVINELNISAIGLPE